MYFFWIDAYVSVLCAVYTSTSIPMAVYFCGEYFCHTCCTTWNHWYGTDVDWTVDTRCTCSHAYARILQLLIYFCLVDFRNKLAIVCYHRSVACTVRFFSTTHASFHSFLILIYHWDRFSVEFLWPNAMTCAYVMCAFWMFERPLSCHAFPLVLSIGIKVKHKHIFE